jgi:hypothetical protein
VPGSPAQRLPARGPLDGTLTLSQFGGNTLRHYLRLFFVIYLRMTELVGGSDVIMEGSLAAAP